MRSRLLCLLVGDGDVAGRVHSDWQGRAFELLQGLLEELGEGREMRRRSADDREHQRESVMRGADDRLGAADVDPGREGSGFGVCGTITNVLRRWRPSTVRGAYLPAAAAPTSDDRDDNRAPTGELPLPVIVRLDEIPGIAPRAAQIIIAEIGLDMTRFPTANHLVSWAKLSPRTIQSGARSRGGKTGKGNPYLKGALGEVATAAAKTNTFLRSGDAATPRRGPGNPAGVVRDSINPVGRIVRSGFLRHWWAKFALAITRPCPVFAVVRRHN